MRAVAAIAAVVLGLMGPTTFVAAQSWGGSEYGDRDRGYRDRDRGYGERDRDRGYRERDRGYGERDRGYGGRRVEFDERDYLRCNPDVRRAVSQGKFGGSGWNHYQEYGRRENRRLSC
jgi:hypothetical protein